MDFRIILSVFVFTTAVFAIPHPHHAPEHKGKDDNEINLNEYRLDPVTNKYHAIGSTKSCKQNMRFVAVPHSHKLGTCDCDKHDCSRPLIYSPKTRQCHWAWSQGPCGNDQWYTFNATLSPVCEKNPCPKSAAKGTMEYFFKDPVDGKCYLAGTKGYCKGDEILMINPYEPIPKCRNSALCYALSIPEEQDCVPGNKRTHDKLC